MIPRPPDRPLVLPGPLPRSEPGESWRKAMAEVNRRLAEGAKKRYRVYGYRIEPGWWAYSFKTVGKPPHVKTEPLRVTAELVEQLGRTLPRCAQRAREHNGGGSKLAITDEKLAEAVGAFLGKRVYLCPLPAPAIGEHWHITSEKKRRGYGSGLS